MFHSQGTFPKKGLKPNKSAKAIQAKKQRKHRKKNKPKVAEIFEPYESTSESGEIQEVSAIITRSRRKKDTSPQQPIVLSDSGEDDNESLQKAIAASCESDMNIVESNEEAEDDQQKEIKNEAHQDQDVVKFREKVADLPMAKVRELQNMIGLKLFNKLYSSNTNDNNVGKPTSSKETSASSQKVSRRFIKNGQHKPREISSKKAVSSTRNIYKNEKIEKKSWDPRFDKRAGDLKEHCFEDNYQFLDAIRQNEREELRKELAIATNNVDQKTIGRITTALRKMEDQERSRKEKGLEKTVMNEVRQENIDRMMSGKNPRYLPKAQLKKRVMEKKFNQLKSENKLDKYLEKKEKKKARKEKKKKPAAGKSTFESMYGYQ